MVFDRVVGNVQPRRNFLVRQAFGHQASQLLLPECQVGSLYHRPSRPALGTLTDVLEEMSAQFGRANRRATERRPHGCEHLLLCAI
jgi:hypothetical protein